MAQEYITAADGSYTPGPGWTPSSVYSAPSSGGGSAPSAPPSSSSSSGSYSGGGSSSAPNNQVTVLVNGTPVTVTETSPGLFGSLGYQYVSGGTNVAPTAGTAVTSTQGATQIDALNQQLSTLQNTLNTLKTSGGTSYTVNPGDTLSQIAAKNGTTVNAIKSANPSIKNEDVIYAGSVLTLPSSGGGSATGSTSSTAEAKKQQELIDLQNKLKDLQKKSAEAAAAGYTGNMQIEYDANGNIIPVNSKPIDMDWMINDPSFKALPSDMQEFLKTYYSTISTGSKENQERLLKALDIAQGQSNAYIGEIIRTTKSELERQIGIKTDDANSQIQELVTGINRIKQDLATGEGDLTVEEQAELKRLQRNYEIKLDSLRENVAAAGLTFSSRRALAESRLEEEQADYIESTERKFARELRDLRLRASRGEEDAQTKIAEIERNRGIDVATLSRTAEQKVGTANLPSSAQGTIGGVAGEVVNKQWEDILARAKGLQSLTNF